MKAGPILLLPYLKGVTLARGGVIFITPKTRPWLPIVRFDTAKPRH
jgi:hypothetical protein